MDLKFPRDDSFLISACILFHKVKAATLNTHPPYDSSQEDIQLRDNNMIRKYHHIQRY